ncbi:hypothetical protein [Mesobacillus jeotgali]|uniref:hypothetical protein n=1 Tax=Mesobacillus jeotgali TaxID=129985 RepID=UPI000C8403F9|nr:hypothetical protein [Mesobacillus jeotgali]
MSEERLDRLEGMMSQLITMVGNLQNSMSDVQKDMKEIQNVQKEHGKKCESIELRIDKMETKNELRHQEVLNQIKRLEKDQDFIWEKAVRNERELEIMKRTLES